MRKKIEEEVHERNVELAQKVKYLESVTKNYKNGDERSDLKPLKKI